MGAKKFSEKKEKRIIEEYLDHSVQVKDLLKKYKCCNTTLTSIRERHGIERRGGLTNRKDYINKALGLHGEGMKSYNIACKLDISTTSVSKILKKAGVEINQSLIARKTELNESSFEKIDDIYSAYWFGFLMSKGNIQYRKDDSKYLIFLLLRESYYESVFKLRRFLKTSKNIAYITSGKTPLYRLGISSKKMCLDLMDKGMLPRKSINRHFNFPEFEDKSFDKFFTRGYLDAKMSVLIAYDKYISFRVTGNKQTLLGIKKVLSDLGLTTSNISKSGKSHILSSSGVENAMKLLDGLYGIQYDDDFSNDKKTLLII